MRETSMARPVRLRRVKILFAASMLAAAVWGHAATLYVDPTGNDANPCTAPATSACKTIGATIAKAASGDAISIAAGTYVEQVTLGKSLTVTGAGAASTIIKLPSTVTSDASLGSTTNVVTIRAASVVSMSALTVAGPGPGNCNSINQGIYVVEGARLTLSASTISSIRDTPFGGCQNGVGLRIGSSAIGQSGSGTITGNTFVDYQKGGIVVDNVGTTAIISGNTITGAGATPAIAQNGIQISRGAVASVQNNVVSGNECDNPTCGSDLATQDQATGILLFDAGAGTVVNENSVAANDAGLWVFEDAAGLGTPINAGSNHFTDNRWEDVLVNNTTLNLTGNVATGSLRGIAAASFVGAARNGTAHLNGGNVVSGNATGIYLFNGNAGGVPAPVVDGSSNQIFGNTTGAANGAAGGTANLTCNWWGTPFGPINASSPLGQGNPVTGPVTFVNWSTDNINFVCNGNPANNLVLATGATIPVPTTSRWLIGVITALLLLSGICMTSRGR
jgi:hypothetical protein